PFKLTVETSAVAVYGPAVLLTGAGREAAAAKSVVRLTRSTCVLGGPLLEVRAGEARGPAVPPVEVAADACLFAAVPLTGRALVELTGVNPDDVKRGSDTSPVQWQTIKPN